MRRIPMIVRFSLYGFLKNQQYYDPFFMLFLLEDKHLSFTMIGWLFGFRELCVVLLEVPTGAVADLFGRRRSMILSFGAYIVSFVLFATCGPVWQLFPAMFFFAVGDAFRTGTHKAMILHWLRLEGREHEKTKTYGYTRSWSKAGSFVSVPIAVAIVLVTGNYTSVFWFCLVPYALGILNFLGYPRELEGEHEGEVSLRTVVAHLWEALRTVFRRLRLLRVIIESMAYEGTFKVITKYYIQPVVKQMALALPALAGMGDKRWAAVLMGVVSLPLFLAAVPASRKAHAFARRFGGESRAARRLWVITALVYAPVAVALWTGVLWLAVLGFVAASILQNFWRPILITRVDNETRSKMGATMLSIESQAKSVGAMLLAPAVGYAVDQATAMSGDPSRPALWVAGAAAAVIAIAGAAVPAMKPARAENVPEDPS